MKPKTLENIKDEYANKMGFENFRKMWIEADWCKSDIDNIARRYAHEMVKHNLEKAADNSHTNCWYDGKEIKVDKESILNTKIELL